MTIRDLAKTIMTNFSYGEGRISTPFNLAQVDDIIKCMIDIKETPEKFAFELNSTNLKALNMLDSNSRVLLLTGGLDSTIAYYRLVLEGKEALPVYVDFGQPYVIKELKAIEALKLPYFYFKEIVPVRYDGPWQHIIPARNLYLLALASELVVSEGEIWISSVAGETPEYGGDKSIAFYTQFEDLLYSEFGKIVHVKCMDEKTKSGWVAWFLNDCDISDLSYEDKVRILKTTVSCFSGSSKLNCGRCRACLRKWICLTYNGVECEDIFEVNPYHGASDLVQEYKDRMSKALAHQDFSYFTKDRCIETLSVFERFEDKLIS